MSFPLSDLLSENYFGGGVGDQSSEDLHLSAGHIKQIIGILRDFIRSPEHRVMASTISKLKMDLDFDSSSINQIHLVLFGFQDAVSVPSGSREHARRQEAH